jgi:hypothetical protein
MIGLTFRKINWRTATPAMPSYATGKGKQRHRNARAPYNETIFNFRVMYKL